MFVLSKPVWDVVKRFVALPPGETTIFNPSITYEVPASQVRNGNPQSRYFINTDSEVLACTALLRRPIAESEVNWCPGVTASVSLQEISRDPFFLVEGANYSDVFVLSRHSETCLLAWGDEYTFTFTESYRFPYTSDTSVYLFFKDPPRYEVEVTTTCVEIDQVLRSVDAAFPDCIRRQ